MFFSREYWDLSPATQKKLDHANENVKNKVKTLTPKGGGDHFWRKSTLLQSTESSRKKSAVNDGTNLRRLKSLKKFWKKFSVGSSKFSVGSSSTEGSHRHIVSESEKRYSFDSARSSFSNVRDSIVSTQKISIKPRASNMSSESENAGGDNVNYMGLNPRTASKLNTARMVRVESVMRDINRINSLDIIKETPIKKKSIVVNVPLNPRTLAKLEKANAIKRASLYSNHETKFDIKKKEPYHFANQTKYDIKKERPDTRQQPVKVFMGKVDTNHYINPYTARKPNKADMIAMKENMRETWHEGGHKVDPTKNSKFRNVKTQKTVSLLELDMLLVDHKKRFEINYDGELIEM